jgi:RHS repeat-associated protein
MVRAINGVLRTLLCITWAAAVQAVELETGAYAAFEKSLEDGVTGLYVAPKEKTLILHGDIAIPIAYKSEAEGYLIPVNSDGSTGVVSIVSFSVNELAADASYSVAPYTLSYSDKSGDGDNDITLDSGSDEPDYVLTNSGVAAILIAPGVPGELPVPSEVISTDIAMSWAPSSGDIVHYAVEEKDDADTWQEVETVKETNVLLTGRTQGYYTYRVRACNGVGCSDYTEEKTIYLNIPVASTITIFNNTGYGSYTVSWLNPISLEPGKYHLLQEQLNDNPWQYTAAALGSTQKSMEFKAEGEYSYRMATCDLYLSLCTYEEPKTVAVSYPPLPTKPGNIEGVSTESEYGLFVLQWGPSSPNVGAYVLEHHHADSSEWDVLQYGLMRRAIVKVRLEGAHYYRVKACNANGCSAYTPVHRVVTSWRNMELTVNTATSTDGHFTLRWTHPVPGLAWDIQELMLGGEWQNLNIDSALTSKTFTREAGDYYYRLVLPDIVNLPYSNTVEVTVILPPPVPGPISGPGSDTDGNYFLRWGEVSQVDYYVLEQRFGSEQWQPVGDNAEITTPSKEFIGNVHGTYQYRVKACSSIDCSNYTSVYSMTVNASGSTSPNNVPAYVLPEGDNNVGAIANSHEVGTDGSATYTIPIATAPGIGGLQPQLSLTYNSNTGNGEVGVGWSISGLSTLHRCGTNLASDNAVDAVDFDDNDKYCLDGQRLVNVLGDYGAEGTQYRTEFDDFSSIESLGSEGTYFVEELISSPYMGATGSTHNPQSFKVVTRDGRTIEYGSTDGSRLSREMAFLACDGTYTEIYEGHPLLNCDDWAYHREDRTYQWMISKVTDRYNNTITFTYDNDDSTGEQRIQDIVYNGDKSRVQFVYQPRTDIAKGYFAGGVTLQGQRLQKVLSYSDNTVLRALNLDYEYSAKTGDSRLISIEECADDDKQHCTRPTTFTWQNGQIGLDSARISPNEYKYVEERAPLPMDVNGDGRTDLMTAAHSTWRYALGNSEGFDPWVDTGIPTTAWKYTQVIDYNNDGKTDLLIPENGYWRIWISSGLVFHDYSTSIPSDGYTKHPKIMDINGDGRSDLVYSHSGNHWYVRLMTETGFGGAINTSAPAYETQKTLVTDINGDGLSDLLVPYSSTWRMYISNGNGFEIHGTSVSTTGSDKSPKIMDVNADGLFDLVLNVSGSWRINLNEGGVFGSTINTGRAAVNSLYARVIDINSDGRADIIYPNTSDNTWRVLRSVGENFASNEVATPTLDYYKHSLIADIKGNGLDTLVSFSESNVRYHRHSGERSDYLTSVSNGMGVDTTFTYKPLNDDSDVNLYDRGGTSVYPLLSENDGNYVVSTLTQSNGIGGVNSTRYQYREKRRHLRGHGSLGFRKMMVTNNDTGIRTESLFSQDYVNRIQGAIEQVKTIAPDGTVLSQTDNQWHTLIVQDGSIDRYRRHLSKTTVVKKDLDGSFLHKEISDYEYDDFDNAKKITSTLYGEDASELRTSVIESNYHNDFEAGLIGLVTRTETTTTVSGKLADQKLVTAQYDLANGRLLVEYIRDPDTASILVETRYGEDVDGVIQTDSFGNNLAKTVKGQNFAVRDTKVSFINGQGRFVQSKTNALGQTLTYQYYGDNEFSAGAYPGKVKLETNPNGISTGFKYDKFGRVIEATAAYGTANAVTHYTRFQWCDSVCREGAVYRVISYTEGGSPSITEIDKLGRTLSESTIGMNGVAISVDYEYNALGHNIALTEPYFESDSAYWNFIDYDLLGRPVETIEPDGRIDTVDYSGLTVASTIDHGGKNQTKTVVRDPLGNLVSVTDTVGKTIYYEYDSAGRQTSVIDPNNSQIDIAYDVFGRKSSMNDPDKGFWQYTYNGLGQLITQTDAKLQTTCMAYDKVGRMVSRIDNYSGGQATSQCGNDAGNPRTATWTYDNAPGASIGRLARVQGEDGYNESYIYDSLGRATQVTHTLKGQNYFTNTSYDNYSRPLTMSYPTSNYHDRLTIKNTYNNLGYATEVRNAETNYLYHAKQAGDARGNLTQALLGNGLTTQRFYNDANGYLTDIKTFNAINGAANPDAQDVHVDFDTIGNLTHRSDTLAQFTEDFDYDGNNRLIESSSDFGMGVRAHSVTYDSSGLGNIKTKSGVGAYTYGESCDGIAAGPHAVTSIAGTKNASYCYDANGNMISGDGRAIRYPHFDKPDEIVTSTHTTRMQYSPGRGLYYREDVKGADTTATTLVGGSYERIFHPDGKIEERHNIAGVSIATYTQKADSSKEQRTRFLHTDHLGSLVAISDEGGVVEERFSFDAWGKRRLTNLLDISNLDDPDNWKSLPETLSSSVTNKGFTGHEQLDGVRLIHMGGRVYDADIGRFLSADPFVQDRTNLQALNRYSYVGNNPLSYTDPSGYFLSKLFKRAKKIFKKHLSIIHPWKYVKKVLQKIAKVKWLSTVITIVLNIIPGCQAWCSMAFNAAMTKANGGTIGDVLKGAAIGLISSGLPGAKQLGGLAGFINGTIDNEIISVMLTSGIMAKAQGGKFIDGVKGVAIAMAGSYIGNKIKGFFKQPKAEPVNTSDSDDKSGSSSSETGCNPINFATGEKTLIVKDHQSQSHSLLKFERYYSSKAKELTGLGKGWRHNFDKRLILEGGNNKPVKVIAVREKGNSIYFDNMVDEGFVNAENEFSELKRLDDRWLLFLEDNSVEEYSADGELQRIEYLGGYTHQLYYEDVGQNEQRQLVRVEDSFGQALQMSYSSNGRLNSVKGTGEALTRYRFDRWGNLTRVNRFANSDTSSSASVTYLYENKQFINAITGVLNEHNERIHSMAYDLHGRAVRSVLADGVEGYTVKFNDNQSSTVTYELGKQNTYYFDKDDNLSKVEGHAATHCLAANQAYRYNNSGQLSSKTDWNNVDTHFEYNKRGLESRRVEAVNTQQERIVTTAWHKTLRLPVEITQPGLIIKFKYSQQGLLVQRSEYEIASERSWVQKLFTQNSVRHWHYDYNEQKLLSAVDGPQKGNRDTTRFKYNEAGRRVAMINALGHQTETLAFNAEGLPTKMRNANDVITSLTYNERGWLSGKTVHSDSTSSTTQFEYDGRSEYNGGGAGVESRGLITAVTHPDGTSLNYYYDTAGRVIGVSNNDGERIDYELDLAGNRVKETVSDSTGDIVYQQQRVFDEMSRLLGILDAEGVSKTQYRYDQAGNASESIDGLGHPTQYAYDALNRLIATTDALKGIVRQQYNKNDQVTQVTDQRGLVTRYRYNGFGEKVLQISPDTGTTTYAYDQAGNMISKRDARGITSEYNYDALNRLIDIHYPSANEEDIHYTYDKAVGSDYAIGRVVKIEDPSGATQYSYNFRGQVVNHAYQIAGREYQVGYQYTDSGQLAAIRYPSGQEVNYRYREGNLASVHRAGQTVVTNLKRRAFGGLASMQYGNGLQLQVNRNKGNQLMSIKVADAANDAIYDARYRYDDVSNIVAIRDGVSPEFSQNFEYDALHRLTEAKGHYGEISYKLDAVGNRTARHWDKADFQSESVNTPEEGSAVLESYRMDESSNRLLAVDTRQSERALGYDLVGNIVSDNRSHENQELIYGANNRLIAVDNRESFSEYVYNAKGQRVRKRVMLADGQVVETHFHYDINDQLIAETDSEGQVVREYLYTANMRVAMVEHIKSKSLDGMLLYIHNDHLGTPKMMTDESRKVVWSISTTPFGETQTSMFNSEDNPLRFPGQYWDLETGYNYNYFRDYDPSLGQYIQSDPIGLNGGVNTFGYVLGNPLKFFDRFGLDGGIDDWGYSGAASAPKLKKNPITIRLVEGPLSQSTANFYTGFEVTASTAAGFTLQGIGFYLGGGGLNAAIGIVNTGNTFNTAYNAWGDPKYLEGDYIIREVTLTPDASYDSGFLRKDSKTVVRGFCPLGAK